MAFAKEQVTKVFDSLAINECSFITDFQDDWFFQAA